jgi:hypothetical protein
LPHKPRVPILLPDKRTLNQINALARIQCTEREAASVLGCSQTLFNRRMNEKDRDNDFAKAWDDGQAQGHMALRRLQWRLATKGNAALAIWLGKQWLGQKDVSVVANANLDDINNSPDKQRDAIESKLDRIAEPATEEGLAAKPDAP